MVVIEEEATEGVLAVSELHGKNIIVTDRKLDGGTR